MALSEDSTSSCILPFEIVEIIIDSLAKENDTASLKAISLVCQSVLPRCQKYLFFSIKIDAESTEKCLAFSSSHTDIPKYIRRLEYRMNGNLLLGTNHSALLGRISFLQSLHLTVCNWIHLDTSARSTLLNLMHLPTLTHLYLSYIRDFPASALFSCANLKHLQLAYVVITHDSQSTFVPSELAKIQEYSFSCSAKTTMTLLTAKLVDGRLALDFTNLKKLCGDLQTDEDFEATLTLLRISKQVEELQIFGCHRVAEIIIAFHTFGTTLSLTLVAGDLDTLHDGLSAIPTTNNTLRSLTLEIFSLDSFLLGNHWGSLNAVLSSLRWVEDISLDILTRDVGSTREKQKSLDHLLKTQLTCLSNRTSPNFKFSVHLKRASAPVMRWLGYRRIGGVGL